MGGRWLFLGFLLTAALQDARKKSVNVWVYVVFAVLSAVWAGYRWLAAGQPPEWMNLFGSISLGLALLGCGMVAGGAVGAGDGCFFVVSGLMLGFWENLALLFYGTILCGSYSLLYLVWSRIHLHRYGGAKTVAYLPFLVPVGIWLVCR